MIHLMITGGTLDKDYQATTGELFFPETHLPEMLSQANCQLDIHQEVLCLKDSLDLQDADRATILKACQNSQAQLIVITHGTDTMVQTAHFLAQSQTLDSKTIVLTGAMRPFKLSQSDALFNLGSALMAAQLKSSGIFITMNGKCFAYDQVEKNLSKGIFEERE